MKVYTAHLRRPGPDEDLVFIREGFCFWAFLFTWAWALVNRLWLFAGVLFGASLGVAGLGALLNLHPAGQSSLALAVAMIAGYLGNDLRRRALEARGYRTMGVVAAPDGDAAARRFLDAHPGLGGHTA